jgi:uncharacterized protein
MEPDDDLVPGQLVLEPRDVRFDWAGLPTRWIPGEAKASHIINVLHLLLPEGERWFVETFKRALPLISDDSLREDVIGFIGQEAIHAEAHQGVLDYFATQGLNTGPYIRHMEWLFRRTLGARPDRDPARQREEIIEDVAIVAAIEHFTAFLGHWVLNADGLDRARAHPVMLDLLRWHGAEEVEHRCVAFDVLVHLDPRYSRRIRAVTTAWPVLAWLWVRGARFLTSADPGCAKVRWRDYAAAARRGVLPAPRAAVRSAARYLRRRYHPTQEASTRQAVAYLASSPAARAAAR